MQSSATPVYPRFQTEQEKVLRVLNRHKALVTRKAPWNDHWQLLGEYVHTRKVNFTGEFQTGEFLNRELFDSVAPKSNKTMASSLIGMLWPASSKRFQFRAPADLKKIGDVKKYYEFITDQVREALDNTSGGLITALDEYMQDQGCFGTSGIEVAESDEEGLDVTYKAWGVKEMTIAEGRDGRVNTVYLTLKFPVHIVVETYGLEKVSKRVRDMYNGNKMDEEVALIIAIEPRLLRDKTKLGVKDMPFQSLHIEVETKHLLRESGFSEMPIKVGRFSKLLGEEYGRSPGMDALPDILEANTIWESVTIAIEKNLDPPIGILDDGRLGNGEIDTGAGGINVFNISGRAGEKNPVFPLYTVGEIKSTVNLLETLAQSIADHFYIDRLLDFNNESQMTLGEAQIRNRMRQATLGSVFARQIVEIFTPIIERTFNILLKKGRLGVLENSTEHMMSIIEGREVMIIPAAVADRMMKGLDVYKIEYFTPAMRIMQAEESEGIFRTWQFALMIAASKPTALDPLDEDYSVERFGEINGAPSKMYRAKDFVDTIRAQRDKDAREARETQAALAGAEAIRNLGQSGMAGMPNGETGRRAA